MATQNSFVEGFHLAYLGKIRLHDELGTWRGPWKSPTTGKIYALQLREQIPAILQVHPLLSIHSRGYEPLCQDSLLWGTGHQSATRLMDDD